MAESALQEQYPYHRRFARHKIRVRVAGRSKQSFSTWTINVSEDGLCFELPTALAVAEEAAVLLFVSRNPKDPPVRATCSIVWVSPGDKGVRHGARFVSFSNGSRECLAAWLAKA